MRTAILGLGGVGGTVAGGLSKYHKDLVFIARGETKKILKENGLNLKSETLGNQIITPSLVSDDPKEIGEVDCLILCNKGYATEDICKKYNSIIKDDTLIVPLQNGVRNRQLVEGFLNGRGIVADSYIYCFSNIIKPGFVNNTNTLLKIGIGFCDSKDNYYARELVRRLNDCGLQAFYGGEIMREIWAKYLMMCGNSCAFIYFDSSAGPIQQDGEKREFLKGIYQDILRLSKACGITGLDDIPDKYFEAFMNFSEDTTTSMYRDIRDEEKSTEFDVLVGGAYELGKERNVDTPFIDKVYKKQRF